MFLEVGASEVYPQGASLLRYLIYAADACESVIRIRIRQSG